MVRSARPLYAVALLVLVGVVQARGQVTEEQDSSFVVLFDKTPGNFRVNRRTNLSRNPNHVSIGEYLQLRSEQELKEIDELCKLTDDQEKSILGALVLDGALLERIISKITSEMDRELRDFTDLDLISPYLQRIGEVDSKIRQAYFKEGSLSRKVLETKLDNGQKELLHQFYLRRFVDRIADGMKLSVERREMLKLRIVESDDRKELVFDPNIHLKEFKKMEPLELLRRTGLEYVLLFNSSMLRTKTID